MIELTLKFKDPKVDGLPKESCWCLVMTSTSNFHEVQFSKIHKMFNCNDRSSKREAKQVSFEDVVFYTEISFDDNKTLAEMNEIADKAWRKRNGYEE